MFKHNESSLVTCVWSKVLRNSNNGLGFFSRVKKLIYPVLAGLAVFTIYPSITAYQDIASLASNAEQKNIVERWLAHIPQAAGVSTAKTYVSADSSFGIDKIQTGSIAPTKVVKQPRLQQIDTSRITTEIKKAKAPQTVNRAAKGRRVVSATKQQPPKNFSAGSVLERHTLLQPIDQGKNIEMAFVKAKPMKEAFQVAAMFHPKKKKHNPLRVKKDLPVMVASLVRSSRSNLLGYAPEPKKKRSPFAAILKNDNAPINLIPKLNKRDHKWAIAPLPRNSYGKKTAAMFGPWYLF